MINCLKLLSIFVLLSISIQFAYSENIISHQVIQAGEILDSNEPIMSDRSIQISLVNPDINGTWFVEFVNENGDYVPALTKPNDGNPLIIDPESIPWAHTFRDKSDSRYHFYIIRVSISCTDNSKDTIELRWKLLPSKPIVEVVDFTYVYDFDEDTIWPNGNLRLKVYSDNVREYCLWASESFLFEFPSIFHCGFPYDAIENDFTCLEYDAEWGEYIAIEAINKYGSILGDMIYTTDYIYDPLILDRIEKIRNKSSVEEIPSDFLPPSFTMNGNLITFETIITEPKIFDISGKLIYSCLNESVIDISNLSAGLYILTYVLDSSINQIKFIKP